MNFSTRNQGIASGTQNRDKTANKLYNMWMRHYAPNNKNIEDIVDADITADNIVFLFAEYAHLLITHPVFHGWSIHGSRKWEDQENPVRIGVDTVMKYYEPIFAQLKAKFPNHAYLKGDESHQQWWVNQKSNLRKGLERQKHRGDGESFNPKCRALYIVNQPDNLRADQRDHLSKCDLKTICSSLIGKSKEMGTSHFEKRAQLLSDAYSVARGGEVKFMRYSNFVYDDHFQVTDIGWSDIKEQKWYSMPMCNVKDPDNFEVDWYHAMGCFYACEGGLMVGHGNDPSRRDFVFPSLHDVVDATVSTQLTMVIRNNLPQALADDVKKQYSSKSMRKAGITLMAAHPFVDYFAAHARSGHSTGGHLDDYIEMVGVGLSLSPMKALNGYINLQKRPSPASFSCLGDAASSKVALLLSTLFTVNHEEFHENGRLYCLLKIIGATLVMSFNKMKMKFGTHNPIVAKLMQIFRNERELGISLLESWSTRIRKSFVDNNQDISPIENVSQLVEAVNQQTSLLIKQQEKLTMLEEAYKHHASCQALSEHQIIQQQEQIHALQVEVRSREENTEALRQQNQILMSTLQQVLSEDNNGSIVESPMKRRCLQQALASPGSTSAMTSGSIRTNVSGTSAVATTLPASNTANNTGLASPKPSIATVLESGLPSFAAASTEAIAITPANTSLEPTQNVPSSPDVHAQAMPAPLGSMPAAGQQVAKGVTIADMLKQLYMQKRLGRHLKDDKSFATGSLNLPFVDRADTNKYHCALELALLVCTKDEITMLRGNNMTDLELNETAKGIEKKSIEKIQKLLKKKRIQGKILGIGNQVLKFKREHGAKTYNDTSLHLCIKAAEKKDNNNNHEDAVPPFSVPADPIRAPAQVQPPQTILANRSNPYKRAPSSQQAQIPQPSRAEAFFAGHRRKRSS